MGSTSDFVAATLADAMLPFFRRPVEDVILETLDQRQVPNRTDFKDLRDLVNHLRGQLSGATGGVKKLADAQEELEDRIDELDALTQRLVPLVEAKLLEHMAAEMDKRIEAAVAAALAAALAAAPDAKSTKKPARKKAVRKTR